MTTTSKYTSLFILFLATKVFVETTLAIRQRKHIQKHRHLVPEKFQTIITLTDHQKAADYNIAKIDSFFVFSLIDLIILLSWTLGGGLNYLGLLLKPFVSAISQLHLGVIFIYIFSIISTLIDLPHSIYSTFVIEKKFGFNKTSPKLFVVDLIKNILLSTILMVPLLYALLFLLERSGSYWWIYAWVMITLFQFFILWIYPVVVAPLFNKFTPLDNNEIIERINALVTKCDLKSSGVFLMNASLRSSHGNAYFTGLGKNKRIVFFDTLIKTLSPDQIIAILAHELGHYKKKHILQSMLISTVTSLIALYFLGIIYNMPIFFSTHGVIIQSTYLALLLFMIVSPVYTFFITPLFSLLSRKNEFEADRFAVAHSKPEDLISALLLLYKDNASTLTPDPLYSAIYHSHPPAQVRIEHLEALK